MDIQAVHTQVNFLSSEQKNEFIKAMKIGYFKIFLSRDLFLPNSLNILYNCSRKDK